MSLSALDPTFRDQPNEYIDQLRSFEPVYRDREFDRVVLTRAEDIDMVLNHRALAKDPRKSRPGSYARMIDTIDENYRPSMLFADDPDHKRLRSLVAKAFNLQSADAMRPRILEVANRLLDGIPDPRHFDVVEVYSNPLPTIVIAAALGIDECDQQDFKRWSDSQGHVFNPRRTKEESANMASGREALQQYFAEIIKKRRKDRGTDLISNLISAEEDGQKLTEAEIISLCYLLLIAGNLTTTDLIGNGVLALLKNPDELAKLRAQPELTRNAIEEILRYDSPVTTASRIATRPMNIGGVDIEEGQPITLLLFGANHDPSAHPHPGKFDIARPDAYHSSFGGGSHFCIGAPLARAEAQIAIPLLFARFPKLRLTQGEFPARKSLVSLNGIRTLWVDTD
ncbi:cytochrome P450 [Acidisarcina polymorpha]